DNFLSALVFSFSQILLGLPPLRRPPAGQQFCYRQFRGGVRSRAHRAGGFRVCPLPDAPIPRRRYFGTSSLLWHATDIVLLGRGDLFSFVIPGIPNWAIRGTRECAAAPHPNR